MAAGDFWLPYSGVVLLPMIVIVYRLYFHPLAHFPGPKLAAATKWYEAYFDLRPNKRGTFIYELKRMHDVYGPIVRITPDEVHIRDSLWINTLYTTPSRGLRDKHLPAAMMAGAPGSGFGTVHHEIHRKRRNSMGPLFSKASTAAMVSTMYDKVDIALQNVDEQIKQHGHADMRLNWLTFNVDVLASCFFDRDMDLLKDEKKAREWSKTVAAVAKTSPFAKQFPWFIPLTRHLPLKVIELFTPEISIFMQLRQDLEAQATKVVELFNKNVNAGTSTSKSKTKLYETILSSSMLDASEKIPSRISQEAFVVLIAGSETTARILSNGTFHILQNGEKVMPRLIQELQEVMPNPSLRPSIQRLEELPWLTAIIKETLRISGHLTSRTPLTAPYESLQYKNWTIPPGTAVSMTLRDVLLDSAIFEDPETFRPERWLSSNPELQYLNEFYVPFGRGSRMCIGINTAMAILYVGFATFFRRYDWSLFDTYYDRDVKIERDFFNGEVSSESRGIRVKYNV